MTGCSGPSCGGSCRLRRRCRPVLAAATDGGASSRWAGIVCQWLALVLLHAYLNSSSRPLLNNNSNNNSSISSTAVRAAVADGPSSTRRVDNRKPTPPSFIITTDSKMMNSKRLLSFPFRASNLASSLTEQPDRPWPTDLESSQVKCLKSLTLSFVFFSFLSWKIFWENKTKNKATTTWHETVNFNL